MKKTTEAKVEKLLQRIENDSTSIKDCRCDQCITVRQVGRLLKEIKANGNCRVKIK